MSELTPLFTSSEDELERLLLGSVAEDEPGPEALRKTAVALGLSTALVTSVTGSAAAAGGELAKSTGVTLLAIVKWLSAGLGAGLLASTAIHFGFRAAPPSPPEMTATEPARSLPHEAPPVRTLAPLAAEEPLAPTSSAAAPRAPAPARGAPTSRDIAEPEPPPAPAAPAPSSAAFPPPAPSHAAFPTAPAPESSLAAETQALDRVRRELEARRPHAALAELARFRERWPNAALRAEAAVLRVEGLLGAGERAAAQREAEALIRAMPQSRHAARVRELLAR